MWGKIVTGLKKKLDFRQKLGKKTCKTYFRFIIINKIIIIYCYNIIIVIHDCTVINFLNFILNRLPNTSQIIVIVKN